MRDAVIVEAVRSPIGKRNGGLAGVHPVDLSAQVLKDLATRTGIDPALIEDVIWGCVDQVGDQSMNVGRLAALAAGFPETVCGTTLDRQCGSSQQSIHFGAAGLVAGQYEWVVAGGIESMTRVPMISNIASATEGSSNQPFGPAFLERYDGIIPNQGVGAEMIAKQWNISRTEQDEFALASHEKAAAAQDAGAFAGQIAPITTPDGTVVTADEGIRRGGTLEKLGTLATPFDPNGSVTAGNASQISDGSAAVLMTTSENAAKAGLKPIARVHTAVIAGADPVIMLTAPIPATAKALAKSGLTLDQIGVFEVNEAFATVPMAWLKETGASDKALNPLGGAIALGHPLGASGARITATLLHHMREHGIQYGLQTMCEGGGMANATIYELL